MAIRAVLFDLGDTLWGFAGDLEGAVLAQYRRAYADIRDLDGWPAPERLMQAVVEQLRAARIAYSSEPGLHQQQPTETLVAAALSAFGLLMPRASVARLTDIIFRAEEALALKQPPEPEMVGAVAGLRQRGLRLGCVSNNVMSAAQIGDILAARGLAPYFECIVSSAEAGYRKPHRGCFEPALQALDVAACECVFVGDRLDADVAGAGALGMTAVLTQQYRCEDPAGSEATADFVIRHLRELGACLDRLATP